jgi:hypothetical protein
VPDLHLADEHGNGIQENTDHPTDDRPVDANELQIFANLSFDRLHHVRDRPITDRVGDEFADSVSVPRGKIDHQVL